MEENKSNIQCNENISGSDPEKNWVNDSIKCMIQLLNIFFSAIEKKWLNLLTSTDNSIKTNMYELCHLLSTIIHDIDPDTEIAEQIAWMEPKLEKENDHIAMIEGKELQIALLESKISENDKLIAEIEPKIKDQDKQTEPKIENHEEHKAIIKNKDDQIAMLISDIKDINRQINKKDQTISKLNKQIQVYYKMHTKYEPKIKLIRFPSLEPFKPTWDNKIAGPGWIVIQRRTDGSISFDKNWNAWKDGFGDPNGDFWLGLERLHRITTYQQHELYIHMVNHNMKTRFAQYNNFVVGSVDEKYELKSLGSYKGDAGDEMRACEKSVFSVYYGLWNPYNSRPQINFNGKFYERTPTSDDPKDYLFWGRKCIQSVQMLVRPIENSN
ncbi:fibrinogen-like protein 1 isoform X2 [Drosophila innubila]|uniref:fibrinogen-like protein 1 isoform X2 n=1 Tax=Drosophila innubila TaxID=198719 RepID=UPI00148CB939|nr:fibrinogen-like protein 1 isoform X2 [Drosophila innubila]